VERTEPSAAGSPGPESRARPVEEQPQPVRRRPWHTGPPVEGSPAPLRGDALVVPGEPLGVDEQAEALVEGEARQLGVLLRRRLTPADVPTARLWPIAGPFASLWGSGTAGVAWPRLMRPHQL